jgi:ribonuclease P protein component
LNHKPPAGGGQPAANAFPRQYRLTQTDEFSSVFGFRKALKSTHFLLHYRLRMTGETGIQAGVPTEIGAGARLGVVVAKRLLKRSVDRNLVKRLARENFRKLRCRLPARDLILRLAAKPKPLDKRALGEEIWALLSKLTT